MFGKLYVIVWLVKVARVKFGKSSVMVPFV